MAVTTTSGVTDLFFTESGAGGLGSYNIIETNTAYVATISDDVIIANGTFIITLPLVANADRVVRIKSTVGGGTITVDGNGSETIDGSLTVALTAGNAATLSPSSSEWVIL